MFLDLAGESNGNIHNLLPLMPEKFPFNFNEWIIEYNKILHHSRYCKRFPIQIENLL